MKPLNIRTFLLRDVRGTPAVEFAIVAPVFLMLIVGMFYCALLLFTDVSMQNAVDDGARCASVKTAVCKDSASTIAYTKAAYNAGASIPVFTSTNTACGHLVTANTNFSFNFLVATMAVPLSAQACFP
jgi:Flp pilus assembly protein TadG